MADQRRDLGTFDYIVVGAGTAGCVLANRLSADPTTRVLVLEAGGKDDYIWLHIPVGYLYTMGNPRTDWCMKTEPVSGLNGRALDYPRGKVLGGCSAINGMIYIRGQSRDYDQWRQLGNVGWGWDDVLPYFKKSEHQVRGADEHHGTGGGLRVEEMPLSWEILDAWRDAAIECGIPPLDDFNRGDNEGVGYFQVHQKKGVRWSHHRGFLKPIMNRPNLHVAIRAEAERLTIADGRVTGIDFRLDGQPATATTRGEVVLSAGSVASPKLLMLSGIGPGGHLGEHGIPVVTDLPGVGENLQDHLQVRLAFKVRNVNTLNERSQTLWGKAGMGLEYFLFRRGPLTMSPSQLGCFAKSDPSRETPNLQYHIQPLTTEKLGEALHPFPAFTASVCNLRPQSRGHLKLRSADPFAHPVIQPDYLSAPADRQVAADAIRLTRRIAQAKALAKYQPEEFKPGLEWAADEDLAREAGNIATTIFHPVGTCKMGDDPMAVVDDRLRLRGLGGLRIADASIMPTITSGNTNAPVTMIAEKAADMMVEDARS